MEKSCDVAVIGAGISGLCAARLLNKNGLSVVVVEARDRVGGRTFTLKDPSFGYTDLGGAYVGPTQNRVFRLAKELGVQVYDVNTKERTILNFKDRWAAFMGDIPPFWNPFILMDLNHVVRLLDSMAKQVPLDAPWKAPKAKEWDSMTIKQFIDSVGWTRTMKDTMDVFVRSLFCVEAHELSLLHALWYINSGGGIERVASRSNGAQEKKFVGGSQQLSEKMTAQMGDCVKLSCPVIRITQSGDSVVVTGSKGEKFCAKYVISAIPQALLNRVQFEPSLPWEKIGLIQRVPMGCIIKTVMFYPKAFWKDMDFNGSVESNFGPVSYCVDDTKPDGTCPAIMGFILADKARELASKPKEERKKELCHHYAKAFRSDKFLHPTNYVEHNWMGEEYSGGCYVGLMAPGVLTQFGKYLRKPCGHVYFAGTESATSWAGYMDGAIEAGERAAREVLCELGKISESEIWQDEPDSPDYPPTPIPTDHIQWLMPSNTAVLRFTMATLVAAFAYGTYIYLNGWRGTAFYHWFRWYHTVDDYFLD